MSTKSQAIHAEIDKLNSSAMTQAMAIFDQTGQYPDIAIPGGNGVGAVALRYALSRRGDPYIWGAAGPGEFDCSGLGMWSYAPEGISLPHFTRRPLDSRLHLSLYQAQP